MRITKWGAALAAVVSLAACSTAPGGQAGDSGSAASGGTIRMAANSDQKSALDPMIAKFEAANPGSTVDVTYADVNGLQASIPTQLSSGSGPDVIQGYPGSGTTISTQALAKKGLLLDLSGEAWASKVAEADKPALSLDGKLYAAPTAAMGIAYQFDKKKMDAAGLTPPTTWSQVQPFCAAAKDKGTVAYAVGQQTGWPSIIAPYALSATLVYGPNPAFADDMAAGSATFAGSKWVEAFDKYKQMQDWGCFNSSPNGTSYDAMLELVTSGKALGTTMVTTIQPTLKQQAPDGDWQAAAFPADDSGSTIMPSAVIVGWTINAKSRNPELAKKFVSFLMDDAQVITAADEGGLTPPFTVQGYQPTAISQYVVDYRATGKITPFVDQFWPNPKVQQDMISGLQGLLSGDQTSTQVLDKMDADYKL